MTRQRTLRGYLDLARLSNAPTCISNALVGWALAGGAGWLPAAAGSAAIVLLYVGGMALNDVVDLDSDRADGRDRPLVRGDVSVNAAHRFIWVCMTLGLGIIALFGVPAFACGLLLVLTIIAYDVLHKRHAWSVGLMGLCRGLVYLTIAACVAWPPDWIPLLWMAGAITSYIVLLTIVARAETRARPGSRRWLALLLPACVAAPLLALGELRIEPAIAALVTIAFITLAAFQLWRTPPRIGAAIQGWLAAICLIDTTFLLMLDQQIAAVVAAACFVVTVAGHRVVRGT